MKGTIMKRLTTIPTPTQMKAVRALARDLGCLIYTDAYLHIKGGYLSILLDAIKNDTLLPLKSYELYITKRTSGQPAGFALRIRRK